VKRRWDEDSLPLRTQRSLLQAAEGHSPAHRPLRLHRGAAIGPKGTGKTGALKNLAKALAIFCALIDCSDSVTAFQRPKAKCCPSSQSSSTASASADLGPEILQLRGEGEPA
jgi:hypothetical protein